MSVLIVSMTTGLILSMENVCVGGLQKNPILGATVITVMWRGVLPVWVTIHENAINVMTLKHQSSMDNVFVLRDSG